MNDNFAQRLMRIKTDIRDLKTAQLVQSSSVASVGHGVIDVPGAGNYKWLIQYEDDGERTPPLIDLPNMGFYQLAILDYDPDTNTQEIQFFWNENYEYGPDGFFFTSSRQIRSFTPEF